MAWTESDLLTISAAIVSGKKAVTFADGRKIEYQSVAEMRQVRSDMIAEISAAASAVNPRTRSTVGVVRRG